MGTEWPAAWRILRSVGAATGSATQREADDVPEMTDKERDDERHDRDDDRGPCCPPQSENKARPNTWCQCQH